MTRPIRRRHAAVVLLTVGVLALTACSSDTTSVHEVKDGRVTVEGDGNKARVTITGENGAVTYNQQQVPAGFPAAVPLPTQLTLENATSATRGDRQYFQLTYALGDASARSALGAYAKRLGGAGFTVDAIDAPSSNTAPAPMQAMGNGWRVVGIATSAGGSGSMVVTVDTNA